MLITDAGPIPVPALFYGGGPPFCKTTYFWMEGTANPTALNPGSSPPDLFYIPGRLTATLPPLGLTIVTTCPEISGSPRCS